MCDTYDYRLFNNITRNPHHIGLLHQYCFPLSPQLQKTITLEHANTMDAPTTHSRLFDSNFIYRALYSDIY